MPDWNETDQSLVDWLKERGHSDDEILAIFERLREYDHLTTIDAIMDAISTGEVDIDAIVKDVQK